MFVGEAQHTIDAKGRLIIPAKYREELGEEFMLAKGLDGCLFIYPMEQWHELESKLRALPLTQKEARSFARFFFSGANEGEMDKQGRLIIPQALREYAQLTKECVVVGVDNRLEVWDQEKWRAYTAQSEDCIEQLAEIIGQSGAF